ncbi:MAG: hypothetical protein MI725_13980 [Pirellulales bacterium]|nr:hypothetical protein [Pirellulales bacterium]
MKPKLSLKTLKQEAAAFGKRESKHKEPSLFGVTDGKAVGTYLEHKFRMRLSKKYKFQEGSSAKGIDFPELGVDMKVTSTKQPQSSCPYKSARQKIYGFGYSVLIFVYEKHDDQHNSTSTLMIKHIVFVSKDRTGDYQTTSGLRKLIDNDANEDDVISFLQERMLPVDDIQASNLANEILKVPPKVGFLTISNALQWRLQYSRVIEKAGSVSGVQRLN